MAAAAIPRNKNSLSQRQGRGKQHRAGPVRFPPPFCEVVEKSIPRRSAWLMKYRDLYPAAFIYSCATAPDSHRFRLIAFPSGGKAPEKRYDILFIVSLMKNSVKRKGKFSCFALRQAVTGAESGTPPAAKGQSTPGKPGTVLTRGLPYNRLTSLRPDRQRNFGSARD